RSLDSRCPTAAAQRVTCGVRRGEGTTMSRKTTWLLCAVAGVVGAAAGGAATWLVITSPGPGEQADRDRGAPAWPGAPGGAPAAGEPAADGAPPHIQRVKLAAGVADLADTDLVAYRFPRHRAAWVLISEAGTLVSTGGVAREACQVTVVLPRSPV